MIIIPHLLFLWCKSRRLNGQFNSTIYTLDCGEEQNCAVCLGRFSARCDFQNQLSTRFSRHVERMPVILSPFASLRGNSAKGLARQAQRSFAALRMTARTPLKSAHGKPSLQISADSRDQWQRAKVCGIMRMFGT